MRTLQKGFEMMISRLLSKWAWHSTKPHSAIGRYGHLLFFRYKLWEFKLFKIRLHQMFNADPELMLHDHPWWYISIILSGGYGETSSNGFKYYHAGSVLFRKASWKHRLSTVDRGTWTLVIHGKAKNKWGFFSLDGKRRLMDGKDGA